MINKKTLGLSILVNLLLVMVAASIAYEKLKNIDIDKLNLEKIEQQNLLNKLTQKHTSLDNIKIVDDFDIDKQSDKFKLIVASIDNGNFEIINKESNTKGRIYLVKSNANNVVTLAYLLNNNISNKVAAVELKTIGFDQKIAALSVQVFGIKKDDK